MHSLLLVSLLLPLQRGLEGDWNVLLGEDVVKQTYSNGRISAVSGPITINGSYKVVGDRFRWVVDEVKVSAGDKLAQDAIAGLVHQEYGRVDGRLRWSGDSSFSVKSGRHLMHFWRPNTPAPQPVIADPSLVKPSKARVISFKPATPVVPGKEWSRVARPEVLGWNSPALEAVKAKAAEIGTTSLFVAQDGVCVFEWGDVAKPHNLRSVRKSVMNGLIGTLVRDGKVRLNQSLAEMGIGEKTPLLPTESAATLDNLLASRSGIFLPAAYEGIGDTLGKPKRGSMQPGEMFLYNNWDFNALGTIYEKYSGVSSFAGFEREFARPLGMQDFKLSLMRYESIPASQHKAYLFSISARDLARYGLLYLNEGKWGSRSILPATWVATSTRAHSVGARSDFDYGYLWWILPNYLPGYLASGNGGQFIYVNPAERLVVTHLVENENLDLRRLVGKDVLLREFRELVLLLLKAKND